MRLILVSGSSYRRASEKNSFIRRLAVRLHEKGHDVSVIAPSENLSFSREVIDGVAVFGVSSFPVFHLEKKLVPMPFLMGVQARNLLKSLAPDVIHVQDHFQLSAAFVRAGRKAGIAVIGTNHYQPDRGFFQDGNRKLAGMAERLRWRQFSKVFNQLSMLTAPTEANAALVRQKLRVRVITVPNGIDLAWKNPFRDNEGIRKKYRLPKRPTLVYSGPIGPADNLVEIMHGVALAARNIDFSFVVIGDGDARFQIEELAEKLSLGENVYFFGELDGQDTEAFYGFGDCFITAEASGRDRFAIMKAMSHGLPVIALDDASLNDLVHDGINGYMFVRGDTDAISNAINIILSIKYVNNGMRRKSLEYIQAHDLDKTVMVFEELYGKSSWVHSVLRDL